MQLAGNKVSTTDPSVPEKEEDKASTEGDATPQNNSVFGLLQVSFALLKPFLTVA